MKYIKTFENYNPLPKGKVIAYHGTPNGGFNQFSYDKRGSGADQHGYGDYGKGFYFTPIIEDALGYAKHLSEEKLGNTPYLYTVRLTMNNPFSFDKINQFDKEYNQLVRKYGHFRIPQQEKDNLYKKLDTSEEEIDFMQELESDMSDNWGDWDIPSKLQEQGYDSLINPDRSEYIVFDSNQIEILKKEPIGKI